MDINMYKCLCRSCIKRIDCTECAFCQSTSAHGAPTVVCPDYDPVAYDCPDEVPHDD